MRFCLKGTQTAEFLNKADEISVKYKDRTTLIDIIHDYPNKTYILDCFGVDMIENWDEIKQFNVMAQNNLILKVANIGMLRACQENDIKRFFGYPILSFYELNSFMMIGVEYVILDTTLFFQMDKMKNFDVKIRAIPNVAYNDGLPHMDGVCGTWIRPEDLATIYEEYIDTVEFEDCDKEKEQVLYRIYAEEKEWRTDLDLIITNLDYPGVNRMIKTEDSKARLDCGHRCQSGSFCKRCYRMFDMANPELIEAIASKLNITN